MLGVILKLLSFVRPYAIHLKDGTKYEKQFVMCTCQLIAAVSSEGRAKLREWAVLACKGRLLLSGSVVLPSLKAAVHGSPNF